MVNHDSSTEELSVRVKCDPRYGFVRELLVRDPGVFDGMNQHWIVKSFEIIRTGPDENPPAAAE